MEEEELWKGYRNIPVADKGKLREPAQAMAVAKCLLSRLVGQRKGENKLLPWDMHPEPCRMCKIDGGRLMAIYEEWMEWSGLNDPANMHKTLIMFQELPRETQRQETRKAQGYVRQVHQASDSDDGTQPDPTQRVAEDGGQVGGPERQHDLGPTPQGRATGRTSSGVRRAEPEGRDPGKQSWTRSWGKPPSTTPTERKGEG